MSARLRVGVVAGQGSLGAVTGHGRAWERLLAHVRAHVDIVEVARPGRARPGEVDVWCFDGHVAPPEVVAPSVVLVHDVRWTDPAIAATTSASFVAVILPETEVAVRSATRVAVPSDFARRGVLDGYGADAARVDIVPYGVDRTVFRPGLAGGREQVAVALRGAVGADTDESGGPRPYVLFVGTVEPRKQLPVLRDAMASLAVTHEHVLALRVGPAPGADSHRALAAAAAALPGAPGRLAVLPQLPERALAAVMAGADALCLPSESEGFGFPVLEAMATGTPVVIAARGSLPELVGDAGVLVEPTTAGVTAGLRAVLDDANRAADLGRRGLARAAQFGWDASACALAASLARAADERGRAAPPAPRRLPAFAAVTELTACPACGAPRRDATRFGTDRVPLLRCARCRAVYATTGFATGALDPDDDARTLDPELSDVPLSGTDAETEAGRAARARLALLAARCAPPGRLLDVRGGRGVEAQVAREAGWDVVVTRTPDEAVMLHDTFDVVVVSHALARERDVVGTLRALRARARPGGWLLVETPNWDSATRRWSLDRWHASRPLEHVVHLTTATMTATLDRAGWETVWSGTRTWLGGDVVRATHALPPFRRVLRSAAARSPRVAAAASGGLRRAYDATGLGDVVVALARRPLSADGPGVAPRPAAGAPGS